MPPPPTRQRPRPRLAPPNKQPENGQLITPPKDQPPTALPESKKKQVKYNILTYLACVQKCQIDITDMVPIEAQGILGRGGQAIVVQTQQSLETTLAFKFRIPEPSTFGSRSWRNGKGDDAAFREICSEVMALGHPEIREHPNIVQLLAVSWELRKKKGWIFGHTLQVWPMMIFEKALHEDLGKFMTVGEGKDLDLAARVGICADLASALAVVHSNDVIHGDIKPENVLVFTGPVVKLADFGFSALASGKSLRLGGTEPWVAPEYDRTGRYTLEQAKLMDLYSYGLLCLWVVFRDRIQEIGSQIPTRHGSLLSRLSSILSRRYQDMTDSPSPAPPDPARGFFAEYNVKDASWNMMRMRALDLVDEMDESGFKMALHRLFTTSLSYKPAERSFGSSAEANFAVVERILRRADANLGNANLSTTANSEPSQEPSPKPSFPAPASFQVWKSLPGLCMTDFRVREHICNKLIEEYNEALDAEQKAQLAVEIAFCKKIGFGCKKDDQRAISLLEEAKSLSPGVLAWGEHSIHDTQMRLRIDACRAPTRQRNRIIRTLYDNGTYLPFYHATHFRSDSDHLWKSMMEAREREVGRMEEALGNTHEAVLQLKWALSTLYAEMGMPIHQLQLLGGVIRDIEDDENHGPHHRDTIMTRVYYTLARHDAFGVQYGDKYIDQDRELLDLLSRNGFEDHNITRILAADLSGVLSNIGHFREATELLKLAKRIAIVRHGEDSIETLNLSAMESDQLFSQGNMAKALEIKKDVLRRMKKLVDPRDPLMHQLRSTLAMALLPSGNLSEAIELMQESEEIIRQNFEPQSLTQLTTTLTRLAVLTSHGKFEEPVLALPNIIDGLRKDPWRPLDVSPPDLTAQELSDLLRTKIEKPATPYPDLQLFVERPELLMARILYATACHAYIFSGGARERRGNKDVLPVNLEHEAEKCLGKAMLAIDRGMGSEEWHLPSAAKGIAGSALRLVMGQEKTPLMEMIASMGARNERNGLHYDKAIAIAQKMGLRKTTALLEEHRHLCARKPADISDPPLFQSQRNLVTWLTGQWKGSYLYEDGGPRRDPKGLRILNLQAVVPEVTTDDDIQDGRSVKVKGTAADDQGTWILRGTADISGNVALRHFLSEGSFEQGWEYHGVVNLERGAVGGYWGSGNISRQLSNGTFFYFKD
ncbi:hypothetical protein CFAM422_010669 [Trichoderma lentiforme]|uniref:Protein kinase domain-containing protein n=1 Tax=Trichoderma lentiforme TaxID=1567552 RepID=A0A9P5C7Z1_9HYPO|nr:hypothetical protein CFAM422_010669 [Trichoderma lentiforme]